MNTIDWPLVALVIASFCMGMATVALSTGRRMALLHLEREFLHRQLKKHGELIDRLLARRSPGPALEDPADWWKRGKRDGSS